MHSAPVPQDVHPQLYQAAGVGAPPGPQWGVPGPAPVPQGPGPTPPTQDWNNRRLAEIQHPQPQPQPPNPYEHREPSIRPPPPPRQQHSPRQEQMMQYRDQNRHTPIRRPTTPPALNNITPSSYSGSQGLPQPPPVTQTSAPNRITNPNYGAPNTGVGLPPTAVHGGPGPMPPYGRGNSPPPEIRPLADDRPPSPGPNYPPPQFGHHPNSSLPGGIAAGAPPPTAAAAAEAAAARERNDQPLASFKHRLDPDEDYKINHKIPANLETRNRLENHHHRRPSPPDRKPSPRGRQTPPRGRQPSPPRHRRGSSEARLEDQRQANENYHPSEAAHHPPTLPSMLQQQPPPQHEHLPPIGENGRDDRREAYEPASRKIEINEDYDDEDNDEKRIGGSGGRNSPQRSIMNGQPKIEAQG